MTTEIYVKEINESLLSAEEEIFSEEIEIKAALAEKIGMEKLAQKDRAALSFKKTEVLGLKPLTDEEQRIWKEWLPTRYLDGKFGVMRAWRDYEFDNIPFSVRQLIADLQEAKTFDSLEIWTPEKVQTDPALFGRIQNRIYLLARWGESDERLISFEKIKDGIDARERAKNAYLQQAWSDLIMVFGGFAVLVLSLVAIEGNKTFLPLSISAAICALGIMWERRISRRIKKIKGEFAYAFKNY